MPYYLTMKKGVNYNYKILLVNYVNNGSVKMFIFEIKLLVFILLLKIFKNYSIMNSNNQEDVWKCRVEL